MFKRWGCWHWWKWSVGDGSGTMYCCECWISKRQNIIAAAEQEGET